MRRAILRRFPVAFLLLAIALHSAPARAQTQTPEERCLAMRLALAGQIVSSSLACHAWGVASRTDPSADCVAHGEDTLAQQLRAAGCASEQQIAALLADARDATALVVGSQVQPSRLAQYESSLWDTLVIADLERAYQPGMSWPDESCRASGRCRGLIVLDCRTTQQASGQLDTTCDSLPESASEVHDAPVLTTENTSLPTGQILSRGSSGTSYEVVVTLSDDGSSYTGSGYIGSLPLFLRGRRIG
jgi:hypothetical protein